MAKAGTSSSVKTASEPDLRATTPQILAQEEILRQGGGESGWDRQHKLGLHTNLMVEKHKHISSSV